MTKADQSNEKKGGAPGRVPQVSLFYISTYLVRLPTNVSAVEEWLQMMRQSKSVTEFTTASVLTARWWMCFPILRSLFCLCRCVMGKYPNSSHSQIKMMMSFASIATSRVDDRFREMCIFSWQMGIFSRRLLFYLCLMKTDDIWTMKPFKFVFWLF